MSQQPTFNELGNNPEHWFEQAEQMHAAGSHLLNTVMVKEALMSTPGDHLLQCGATEGGMMLLAVSIENALKGLAISQQKSNLYNGQVLRWDMKGSNTHKCSGIVNLAT